MTQAIIHTLSISHQAGLVQIPSSLKALNDDEVRIDTLFSGINKNDLLYLDGKHKKDYFGVQAIGKVVAIGKNVGHCKVNDIVGVYHGNTNSGDFKTGFSTSLQANQKDIIYIPNTIAPEQAASLLGSGTTAFNALQKFDKGSHIAVVGTGLLAYLTSQYATKFFGFKVTLFGYEGSAYLAQFFGAEEFIILSNETINKNIQKYHNIVITEPVKEADAVYVQNIAYRTGKVVMAIDMGYYPEIKVFDLVCSQREFVGVKRGSYKQAVRALQAAVFHGVRANVQVFTRQDFAKAFERARQGDAVSVVLKY